jgi:hypothetical protein
MERRIEQRWVANASVSCRIPATPIPVTICNVSKRGCHVRIGELHDVRKGISILIDLTPDLTVLGRVIWQEGNDFGVRFDRPLTDDAVAQAVSGIEPERDPIARPASSVGSWLRAKLR